MKTGLNKKVWVDGPFVEVRLDVIDVQTNKVVFTGAAKAVSKFVPCKLSNVNSALRSGSTCQKKYKIKYASEKRT